MRERTKLSSHLYVRVDSPLREALADAAEAAGVTVSDLARRELRKALADTGRSQDGQHSPDVRNGAEPAP